MGGVAPVRSAAVRRVMPVACRPAPVALVPSVAAFCPAARLIIAVLRVNFPLLTRLFAAPPPAGRRRSPNCIVKISGRAAAAAAAARAGAGAGAVQEQPPLSRLCVEGTRHAVYSMLRDGVRAVMPQIEGRALSCRLLIEVVLDSCRYGYYVTCENRL